MILTLLTLLSSSHLRHPKPAAMKSVREAEGTAPPVMCHSASKSGGFGFVRRAVK